MSGKRAETRTTKTLALDKSTVDFIMELARARNSNASNVIEEIVKKYQKEKNEKDSKKGKKD